MEYKDIEAANKTLKTTPIKGKDYATVNERIKAFRQLYPEGTIETEILSLNDGIVTMKATVKDTEVILGTGHAQEKESSGYINKTSYIENCETSAVGRALGMLGIGIDTSFASFDEVANAQLNQGGAEDKPKGSGKQAEKKQAPEKKQPANKQPAPASGEERLSNKITAKQAETVSNLCAEYGIKSDCVKWAFGIENIEDMTQEKYSRFINTISNEEQRARLKETSDKWKAKAD